ncbi:hypothetical protein MPRG_64040 [Mycobacterium paragordonae]|uniref:Uncharacterized protein n=1 Tax=Mycobacterium paragordonae TaxID=1389713 RepID=A0ABQ1CF76_9MYCO|nr:hypothetical protein [Mycobacterium paragordonae]GFG83128.1 hypothetical protein MPRG_64040 [Mycobacterium paragordonae]
MRDLIVDYLRERQASLDYSSLDMTCRTLAGLFWARIEAIHPEINNLHLPPGHRQEMEGGHRHEEAQRH